jgi:mono/diheme cytochrome c family protein
VKERPLPGSKAAALLLCLAASAGAAAPCASCHREQAHTQPATDMAWALMPPNTNPVLLRRPKLTLRRGAYTYTVERRDGGAIYSVTDGGNTLSLPVRWAFGARSQTWVLEYNGRFYESLVSYFASLDGLDITIGDASIQPHTLAEAMGRELSDFETQSCFNCHATAAVSKGVLHLDGLTAGVQCERCHVGAARHAESFAAGKPEMPAKLAALSPEEVSNFCGQCHRTWERVVRDRLRGPINVRFQPYRLANSRCYDGGDRRMSCITCHDPHREITRGPEAYDAKCLACHTQASTAAGVKVCHTATAKCAECHMPKVELPGGHMIFTDHQIRVVRAGDAYPN